MAFPPSAPPSLCIECGKPSIAICPYCSAYVHHGYGAYNGTCSLLHEQKCEGARKSREPEPKQMMMGELFADLTPKNNGRCNHDKHVGLKPKKKGRR